MNALTPVNFNPQLPDFLRDPALFQVNDAASAGIGGGMPARISIRQSRFRLIDEAGEEQMVNTFTLPVVVLFANEHISKTYYEGAYDPAAGNAVAPTCFSDNGVAPSDRAGSPQSARCAGCPHGAWGSKVTPSGTQIKACSDSKKVVVVLAAPVQTQANGLNGVVAPAETTYLLQVPAASMRAFGDMVKSVRARGVPLVGCVVQLGFDPNASYPALTFQPVSMVTRELYDKFKPILDRDLEKLREMVGATDRPINAAGTAASPAALAAPAVASAPFPPAPAAAPPSTAPAAPPPAPAAPPAATGTAAPGRRRRGAAAATAQAAQAEGLLPTASAATASPAVAASPAFPPSQATGTAASASPSNGAASSQVIPPAALQSTSPEMDALLGDLFKAPA